MSNLAEDFKNSRSVAVWRMLWRIFPNFSAKYAPVYFAKDGAALWSQGFGRIAYLQGSKVLMVSWGLGSEPNERRVLVSQATRWEPPNTDSPVSLSEREALVALLKERYERKGEKVVVQ